MAEEQTPNWQLPLSVVGPIDVGRLLRELDSIDDFLMQGTIREPGTPVKMPKLTRLMDEVIQLNQLNMLVEPDRVKLRGFLDLLKRKAPVLHMSFSADPSPLFMQKMMIYLRTQISPSVLVRIGLQPTIGVGCVVRSTNKSFDLSLRERFRQNRQVLVKKLEEIQVAQSKTDSPVPATAPQQVAS